VIGMSVKAAVSALKDAKLKVSFAFAPRDRDYLKVIKQDPNAGAAVDPGTTVTITISLPSLSLPDNKPTQPMPLPAEQPAATPQPSLPTTP
jgi:beta-lactam-binding protein with PASTA domain